MHTQTDSDSNDGVDYDFFGVDIAYETNLPVGEGHVHLVAQTTSSDFEDRNKNGGNTSIDGVSLSLDQDIGQDFGVFMRIGASNNDSKELVHDELYSAGLQINGRLVSVPELVMGFAYAYLDGAGYRENDIRHTRVFESYARYSVHDIGDISADVQWVSDNVIDADNPRQWVIGTRLNLYF
jgi:hypothetical protein